MMAVKYVRCFKIQDSSSTICDLNANTASEVCGSKSVAFEEEADCVQIPHLDLRNVSEDDKWEGNFTHTHFPDIICN